MNHLITFACFIIGFVGLVLLSTAQPLIELYVTGYVAVIAVVTIIELVRFK